MEFDKQILRSYEPAPLCGSLLKSKRRVHGLRGRGILRYCYGKVMEFCCKNFVATLYNSMTFKMNHVKDRDFIITVDTVMS